MKNSKLTVYFYVRNGVNFWSQFPAPNGVNTAIAIVEPTTEWPSEISTSDWKIGDVLGGEYIYPDDSSDRIKVVSFKNT